MKIITLPAQPHPVEFDLHSTALMVIDTQRDFLYPGGYGELLGNNPLILQRTIGPIQRLLAVARRGGMLIIHTREGHLPDLSDCPQTKLLRWSAGRRIGDKGPMGRILIRGEMGHAIIDEVAPITGEKVIDKPGKCAFYKTDLDKQLQCRNIRTILYAGVTTDVCGVTTIAAGNDRGYNGIVLSDCMASYDETRHTAALNIIKAQGGIFGWVSDSTSVLKAITGQQYPPRTKTQRG